MATVTLAHSSPTCWLLEVLLASCLLHPWLSKQPGLPGSRPAPPRLPERLWVQIPFSCQSGKHCWGDFKRNFQNLKQQKSDLYREYSLLFQDRAIQSGWFTEHSSLVTPVSVAQESVYLVTPASQAQELVSLVTPA